MNTIMKRNGNNKNAVPTFSGVMDRLFQPNLGRFFEDDFFGPETANRTMNIPVNIKETDKTFELELVAPGMKKEDFKINVSGDVLTVSFEQKEENREENKEEGWIRREYSTQSFSRSFNMGDTVDANKISAQYSNGVLQLTLPKKETAQRITRNIEIS